MVCVWCWGKGGVGEGVQPECGTLIFDCISFNFLGHFNTDTTYEQCSSWEGILIEKIIIPKVINICLTCTCIQIAATPNQLT